MVTIANQDQTFEYHIQLDTISKIVLLEKNTTDHRTLRIIRFLNQFNDTMSSIIFIDTSELAQNFFTNLIQRYGNEIHL
jgi:putative heme iron utilization protein